MTRNIRRGYIEVKSKASISCNSITHVKIIFVRQSNWAGKVIRLRAGRFSVYIRMTEFFLLVLVHFALISEQPSSSTGSPHTGMQKPQNDDDIKGMDDSGDESDNPQVPDNVPQHHVQNLNYGVMYNINSFNHHNFSGNHSNGWFLSLCRRSSILSDEARPFTSIRSILTFATWSGTTSLTKFYSHPGSLVLHRAIFIDHIFLLSYIFRHSLAYRPWEKHSISILAIGVSNCTYYY